MKQLKTELNNFKGHLLYKAFHKYLTEEYETRVNLILETTDSVEVTRYIGEAKALKQMLDCFPSN